MLAVRYIKIASNIHGTVPVHRVPQVIDETGPMEMLADLHNLPRQSLLPAKRMPPPSLLKRVLPVAQRGVKEAKMAV